MITQEHEELAALHALDLLEGEELSRFELACAADPALRELTGQLRETVGRLAITAPSRTPPAQVWERILREIKPASETPSPIVRPQFTAPASPFPWLPWAIAAALAICCGALLFRPVETPAPVARTEPALSVAVLKSAEEGYAVGDVVVVWNPATQTGILDLARMPRPGDDRDYQLWVIDPQYEKPVDGGVFAVDVSGNGKLTFHPKQPITQAKVFAISLEPRGGSESARGPIVMASR